MKHDAVSEGKSINVSFAKFVNYIWAILHKTFTIEKLVILTRVFFLYSKITGKIMLTGVFRFYQMVKVLCNRALLYFVGLLLFVQLQIDIFLS